MLYWTEGNELNVKLPKYFAGREEKDHFLKLRERFSKNQNFNVDFSSVEKMNTLGCLILTSWWNHSIINRVDMRIIQVDSNLTKGMNKIGLGKLLEPTQNIKSKASAR